MRRTFHVIILLAVVASMATLAAPAAHAFKLSELIWGRHRVYKTPGINFAVDEYIPQEWANDSILSQRFHKPGAPIFKGERLEIGIMLMTGTESGREMIVAISDRNSLIRRNADGKWDRQKLTTSEKNLGGLRELGRFWGKFGAVTLDTSSVEPGTVWLYVLAKKGGKYESTGEKALALYIAPPLPEVIEAMQDAPDETVREWGLVANYPTLAEVAGPPVDQTPSEVDIKFADGGYIRRAKIVGRPKVGGLLGIKVPEFDGVMTFVGAVKIDEVRDGEFYSQSSSRFLNALRSRGGELEFEWVVRSRAHSVTRARELTETQKRNLATFPDGPLGDPNFGLQNAVYEMATAPNPVMHLNTGYINPKTKKPYVTAAEIWYRYQEFTKTQFSYAPDRDIYVPAAQAKKLRVVRLGPGGVPEVVIEVAQRHEVNQASPINAIGYMVGQRLRRPDNVRVDNNNTNTNEATADADAIAENQNDINIDVDQQQEQEQLVDIKEGGPPPPVDP